LSVSRGWSRRHTSEGNLADEASIPVYPLLQIDARKSYVQGWGPTNVNDAFTWNVQDWWLSQ